MQRYIRLTGIDEAGATETLRLKRYAGMGEGDFYAEPTPQVTVRRPSIFWHLSKVMFEKYWLHKWF
jgi:hypothetical protein